MGPSGRRRGRTARAAWGSTACRGGPKLRGVSGLHITIANKNYSSWSLRAYLALVATKAPFTEEKVLLDTDGYRDRIAKAGGAGLVPVLRDGDLAVWDSLAICEYLAERFPQAGLWPEDPSARAVARSVAAEMHAGFAALRTHYPMDMRSRKQRPPTDAVSADITRITDLWRMCRDRFGGDGDMLFGRFSIADCMYAPVASRFQTYGVDLDPVCAGYRDAVLGLPAMKAWCEEAIEEPILARYA